MGSRCRGTAFLLPLLAVAGGALVGIAWGTIPNQWLWIALSVAAVLVLTRRPARRTRVSDGRQPGAPSRSPPAAPPARAEPDDDIGRVMLALQDLGIAVILTDASGAVLRANEIAGELLQQDGGMPRAALDLSGAFFGLPVEQAKDLASLHRFFGSEDDSGEGVVICTGSRRQIYWRGRLLSGAEGFGTGRLFVVRDVTSEQRLEAMKTDFLGVMSHELRTPLTALRGSLQLVLTRADALGAADREMLEIGIKNAERLIRLTNDLLDVDHLERGSDAFRFETVDVRALLEAAVQATESACRARNLRVVIETEDPVPGVFGDNERLVQVLVNLLDNTARYAPAGSTVTLQARSRDPGVQIDVHDAGPGIPAAEQPYIFERFWCANRAGADAGTGLGLSICRAIVQRHNGHIWVESVEGQGATFSMVLPRSLFRAQPEDADATPYASEKRVVLVIEDDPDTRAVTRAALELHGYELLEAGTGVQGVNVARNDQPSVILLDVALPDLNGYDVLRVLKNDPETKDIPVIILSVEPRRELAERLGAADVLQKPARFEAVRCTIARVLRRAQQPPGRLVLGMGPSVSRDVTVLAQALERESHEVYRGRDLDDLAGWSAAHFPDLLVLDEDTLPASRADVAKILRHPVTGVAIPLVFLTTAHPAGAEVDGYTRLGKPITKDEFMEAAARLVTHVSSR